MARKFDSGRAGIWVEPEREVLQDDRTKIDFIAEVDVPIIGRSLFIHSAAFAVNRASLGTSVRSISSRTSCSTGSSVTTSACTTPARSVPVHRKRISARRANVELDGEVRNLDDPEGGRERSCAARRSPPRENAFLRGERGRSEPESETAHAHRRVACSSLGFRETVFRRDEARPSRCALPIERPSSGIPRARLPACPACIPGKTLRAMASARAESSSPSAAR